MKRLVLCLCVFSAACGGSPSAPSYASMAGNWTGTMQFTQPLTGLAAVGYAMNLTQAGSAVNGSWATQNLNGTLSGATTANSFSGMFTFNTVATNGTACSGSFAVAGPAGGNTVTWTSPGVTGNCTNAPLNITIAAQLR